MLAVAHEGENSNYSQAHIQAICNFINMFVLKLKKGDFQIL